MTIIRRASSYLAVVCAAAALTACADSPSAPSGGGSATVTVPMPAAPAANAQIRFSEQPVTLTVQNAAVTGSGTVYTFEVASDSAFSSRVQNWQNVAEGAAGQTSVRLDTLAGGRDYYWRARATSGGTAGPFSAGAKFTIGPPVIVNPPTPIAPLTGTTTGPRPTFRVRNATRNGAAGVIYRFEIAGSSAFSPIVLSVTVNEGVNETGFTPVNDLPTNTTLYWRAIAADTATGIASEPSVVQSFATRAFSQAERIAFQLGFTLWPVAQPGGSLGHATMGDPGFFGVGWQPQTLFYQPGRLFFQSPDLEQLRYFDLFDRGYDPDGAIAWMLSNGYPTIAQWYPPPEKGVMGFQYVYVAARNKVVSNGIWDIVVRVE
jgi:hypothetical protein